MTAIEMIRQTGFVRAAVEQLSAADHQRVKEQIEKDIARETKESGRASFRHRLTEAFRERKILEPEPQTGAAAGVSWYQAHGFYDDAEKQEEISNADRAFAFSANGEFLALAQEKTGQVADAGNLSGWQRDQKTLLRQSFEIADKMTAAGWNAYRETPFGLFRYFVHSGHLEKIPAFRRSCIIPYVAQMERAATVAALTSFLECNPFARMWVMTSGPRTPLCDLRRTISAFHGRISDLNAAPFMREFGVEIVFRSTELGTPELSGAAGGEIETDAEGQLYFHVHAHLVIIQKFGFIPPDRWTEFQKKVQDFWGCWWKDGSDDRSGLIVNPREVCKYVTKPAAIARLTGEQIVALQNQLRRLKLVHAMGQLAAEIKARGTTKRLVRVQTPDGPVYREVKNWNAHARRTDTDKDFAAGEKLNKPPGASADFLKIVSRQLPRFGPSGISEPTVIVMCQMWDESRVRRIGCVAQLIAATAENFSAARIRVHKCTPTVETRAFDFMSTGDPTDRRRKTGAELGAFAR